MKTLTAIAAALSVAAASPAFALSCAPWSATGAYNSAQASLGNFDVGFGTITPLGAVPTGGPGVSYEFQAVFSGMLIAGGFMQPQTPTPVQVHVGCLSIWCGADPSGQPVLVFLDSGPGQSYDLHVGPCPQWVRANPTQAEVDQILQCSQGGAC